MSRAIYQKETDFFQRDFWAQRRDNVSGMYLANLPDSKSGKDVSNYRKLNATEHPYHLNKNVLRKIRNRSFFFYTTSFYQRLSDGKIFCEGNLVNFDIPCARDYEQVQYKERKRLQFRAKYFILLEHLHLSNSFFYEEEECVNGRTQQNFWFQEWIYS